MNIVEKSQKNDISRKITKKKILVDLVGKSQKNMDRSRKNTKNIIEIWSERHKKKYIYIFFLCDVVGKSQKKIWFDLVGKSQKNMDLSRKNTKKILWKHGRKGTKKYFFV